VKAIKVPKSPKVLHAMLDKVIAKGDTKEREAVAFLLALTSSDRTPASPKPARKAGVR
jgi:hypothetical protein